jgi:hypothetical protein
MGLFMILTLNSHHTEAQHQAAFLGKTHPHVRDGVTQQHPHDEVVLGKDCEGWLKEWVQWLLRIPHDKSPLFNQDTNPLDRGYESKFPVKPDEGIWFLAAPSYSIGGSTGYVNRYEVIDVGNWHIFLVPYWIYNSTAEYPSLKNDSLFELAKKQVDSVYRLEVILDGMALECCRVTIDTPFTAEIIRKKNVLNISANNKILPVTGKLKGIELSKIEIVGDGYACFLNPLEPGLHLLSYRAYSPTYSLDTQIQFNVRGPK